jgi:hypothetical protein
MGDPAGPACSSCPDTLFFGENLIAGRLSAVLIVPGASAESPDVRLIQGLSAGVLQLLS